MAESLLDCLLSVAAEELKKDQPATRTLKETDIFSKEEEVEAPIGSKNVSKSSFHTGDTDSSDDEDNKYHEERKYNACGRDIKHLLSTPSTSDSRLREARPEVSWKSKPATQPKILPKPQDAQCDPIFGLKIVNPVISFNTLQDRMVGREAIPFSRIQQFVTGNISDKNWVIAGVIVGKSSVRTSQKGNQFLIWTLSDLKNDIKTVALFLFGSAYKQLWKTTTGTVVGILNPSVLEKKNHSKDEATLSVDNSQKVMIMGQSKDLGTCKSIKKNGEQCTAIVNISQCDYCIYHIKQEYQKCSRRSELQSNFAGKGLTALRNKVLGKNEVFYAGKSYTAIPAKRSRKLDEKNENLLKALSGNAPLIQKKPPKKKVQKAAANIEVTQRQRLKDLSLLERLGGSEVKTDFKASHSAEVTLESSRKAAIEVISKLKATIASKNVIETSTNKEKITCSESQKTVKTSTINIPVLSGNDKGVIDLGVSVTPQQKNRAKLTALKYVQKNGPLKKSDPNSVKSPGNRKRVLENIDNIDPTAKKAKIVENEFLSERFKKIMETSSKHLDLLDVRDNEEQEKYFTKLEKKEQMEDKMINTFKVPCKGVRCLQCKYTNFSASQYCKDNKHPLKVFDTVKRFFKCGDCGNRITSLEIVPTVSCKNCGSGKWERTGMMKEKTVDVAPTLSIRGGEQKFTNSVISDANLNLLVPDE